MILIKSSRLGLEYVRVRCAVSLLVRILLLTPRTDVRYQTGIGNSSRDWVSSTLPHFIHITLFGALVFFVHNVVGVHLRNH